MELENYRQFVHLGGLVFILMAQLIGKLIGIYLIMASIFFLLYSQFLKSEHERISMLSRMEGRIRDTMLVLERRGRRPFTGAFWFFLSCGLAFLLFPLHIASAACAILAVGDCFSTLFGRKFGRHRIAGMKTLEGSAAFIIGAFISASFFVGYAVALFASLLAAAAEILPALPPLSAIEKRGIIDDNWMIPIFSGLFMLLAL